MLCQPLINRRCSAEVRSGVTPSRVGYTDVVVRLVAQHRVAAALTNMLEQPDPLCASLIDDELNGVLKLCCKELLDDLSRLLVTPLSGLSIERYRSVDISAHPTALHIDVAPQKIRVPRNIRSAYIR